MANFGLRPGGFYWVWREGEWIVAEWGAFWAGTIFGAWRTTDSGPTDTFSDDTFEKIGPKIEPPTEP